MPIAGIVAQHREPVITFAERISRNTVQRMTSDRRSEVWQSKDGQAWPVGRDAEVAWIEENTESGLTIMSAIPPVFEAYATLELPGTGKQPPASSVEEWEQRDKEWDRHEAAVLAVFSEYSVPQPWWLGYLDSGETDLIFGDTRQVRFYADWPYVLIQAGPDQARVWRGDDCWKGVLPDLMFPADHSWLFSTLWDDDWTCIGGSRRLVEAFLAHPDLRARTREVDPSTKDATPPGIQRCSRPALRRVHNWPVRLDD